MAGCNQTRPLWFWLLPAVLGAVSLTAFAEGMQIPRPSSGLMPNPVVGKGLYEQNCASCRGAQRALR